MQTTVYILVLSDKELLVLIDKELLVHIDKELLRSINTDEHIKIVKKFPKERKKN
jgi:hypothetical protein